MSLMALLSVALLWLLGASVSSAVGLGRVRSVDDAPLHLALGACLLGLLGTLAVIAGVGLHPWQFHALIAAAAAVAFLLHRRGKIGPAASVERPVRPPLPGQTRVLLGAGVVVWAAVAAACFQDRLWWDGWQNWVFKARVLFAEGTLPAAFLDRAGPYTPANLDYPLLAPLSDWWAFSHVAAASAQAASLTGAAWAGALALLAWSALRDRVDTRVAAAAAVGVAAFWPVAFFAIGGTADVFVAVALMGAAVELERAVRTRDARPVWRAAVFLALGALAKNEGIALAVLGFVAGSAALAASGERRPGRILPLALAPLAAAPWYLHTRSMGLAAGASSAAAAGDLGERFGIVLSALGELFGSLGWMPVPLLVAAGIASAVRRRDGALAGPWGLLLAYVATVTATYVLTSANVVALILTSSTRVFGAMVPAFVVLAALSVGDAPPAVARGD
jgi:hypothetical protein